MAGDTRKRLFIDRRVQGTLLLRVTIYWFLSILTTALVLGTLEYSKGAGAMRWDRLWEEFAAILAASALMLPILLVDALIVSSRFAGPVARVRSLMRKLSTSQPVQGIDLRKTDFWPDLARDFNALLVYVKMLQAQSERASHLPPANEEERAAAWETAR